MTKHRWRWRKESYLLLFPNLFTTKKEFYHYFDLSNDFSTKIFDDMDRKISQNKNQKEPRMKKWMIKTERFLSFSQNIHSSYLRLISMRDQNFVLFKKRKKNYVTFVALLEIFLI